MKLIISKTDNNTISMKIKIGEEEQEFSYVEMIKLLCKNNAFEKTEYGEGITDLEKEKINNMLTRINAKVTTLEDE